MTNEGKALMGDSMRRGVLALVAGVVLASGPVGCQNGQKADVEALQMENEELRQRYEDAEAALRAAEDRNISLADAREQLAAENERLRQERQSAAQNPVTGFEGIAGTETSFRAGELVVSVAGDVLFDSGKATLKSSAKSTLDTIANVIRSQYAGHTIRVAGHTDNDPIRKSGWKTNERLSAERALAVEEYLAQKGISKDQMYVAAYGPAHPKGSKKESRRVEIVILNSSGS